MDLLLSDVEKILGKPLSNAQKEVLRIAANEVHKGEWSFAKTLLALQKTTDFDTPLPDNVRQKLLHPFDAPQTAPQTPPPPEYKLPTSPPPLPTQENVMEDSLARLYQLLQAEMDFWENKSAPVKRLTPQVIDKFMTAIIELGEYVREKKIAEFILSFRDNIGPSKIRSCFRTNSAMKHFAGDKRENAERLLIRVCEKVLTILRKLDREKWDKAYKDVSLPKAQEYMQLSKYSLEQDMSQPEVDEAAPRSSSQPMDMDLSDFQ